jgi:hypothetical protein
MELFTATVKLKKFFLKKTRDVLCVLQDLEYRIDVFYVTRGAHIEQL